MIFTTIFTTIIWVLITYITNPEPIENLKNFYNKINPSGPGWKNINSNYESIIPLLLNTILGIITIQTFLFGSGKIIFGELLIGLSWLMLGMFSLIILLKRI